MISGKLLIVGGASEKIVDKREERAEAFGYANRNYDYGHGYNFPPAMNKYQAMERYGADYQEYNYYSSDDDEPWQRKIPNPAYNTAELFDLLGGRKFKHALLGNVPHSDMIGFHFGGMVGDKIVIFGKKSKRMEIVGEPDKILKLENFSGGSGVVVNESTIWLVETGSSKASSFISLNENGDLSLEPGPDSPFRVWGPLIQFDESTIYVLGAEGQPKENSSGEPSTSKPKRKKKGNGWSKVGKSTKKAGPIQVKDPRQTWIVDPTNNYSWKEGPPMIETKKEANLVCAKMIMDGRVVIVAVAKHAHKAAYKPKMSVEILDPKASDKWQLGNCIFFLFFSKISFNPLCKFSLIFLQVLYFRSKRNSVSKMLLWLRRLMEKELYSLEAPWRRPMTLKVSI